MKKSIKSSNKKNSIKSTNKSRTSVSKMRGGANYFYSVMTGTLGYFAATFIYGFILLLILIGFVVGVYLIYTSKECETIEEEGDDVNETQDNYRFSRRRRRRSKRRTECKSYSELDGVAKTKFVIGCILTFIFGIILLIILIPYIIEGFARAFGFMAADYAMDRIF